MLNSQAVLRAELLRFDIEMEQHINGKRLAAVKTQK